MKPAHALQPLRGLPSKGLLESALLSFQDLARWGLVRGLPDEPTCALSSGAKGGRLSVCNGAILAAAPSLLSSLPVAVRLQPPPFCAGGALAPLGVGG